MSGCNEMECHPGPHNSVKKDLIWEFDGGPGAAKIETVRAFLENHSKKNRLSLIRWAYRT
jgi:hypothetical protein